nr:MAG TPA_asm: hypothetical protein [Caudoviricetes sp.]
MSFSCFKGINNLLLQPLYTRLHYKYLTKNFDM